MLINELFEHISFLTIENLKNVEHISFLTIENLKNIKRSNKIAKID